MNRYTFFWSNGSREVFEGETPAQALMLNGYGQSSLVRLDFYTPGDNNDYTWDRLARKWNIKRKRIAEAEPASDYDLSQTNQQVAGKGNNSSNSQ